MMDILIPVILAIVPIVLFGLYGYLIIDTPKRLFKESSSKKPKILFTISALLPVFAILVSILSSSLYKPMPSCEPYWMAPIEPPIDWQKMKEYVIIIFAVIPVLLFIFAFILQFKATAQDKIIYRRTCYVLFSLILISVIIFTSLNTARVSSNDSRRKSTLASFRASAELYWDQNNHYPIVQGRDRAERWEKLKALVPNMNIDDPCYISTNDQHFQYDYQSSADGAKYVATTVLSFLRSDGTRFWCVDSDGNARAIKELPKEGQFSCKEL